MNTAYPSFSHRGKNNLTRPIVQAAPGMPSTDILTVTFNPKTKLLCAQWLKQVSSAEYRQSVRMIARSAALLRAELVLMDMTCIVPVSDVECHWTESFLKEALQKSAIRRSARVIRVAGHNQDTLQQAMGDFGQLPYEVGLFNEINTAKQWLMGGQEADHINGSTFAVPLNFNLKMIRNEMLRSAGIGLPAAPVQAAEKTGTSDVLPETLSIRTDTMTLTIEQNESIMTLKWLKPPQSRQYRYGMLKACRAMIEHKLEYLLLNNQRLGVLTLEDQGWLIGKAIELIPKSKLKKMAVVTSVDALQQMSSENIGCKLEQAQLQHVTRYFLSEEDAREWLLLHEEG